MGYWVWAIVPALCAVMLAVVVVQEIRGAIRDARCRRRLRRIVAQGRAR